MKKLWIVLLLTTCLCAQPTGMKPMLGIQLDWVNPKTKRLVGAWFNQEAAPALGTLYDISGNGNNGMLVNDTHSVPGKFGPALDFDGTNDYVQIPDTEALRFDSGSQDFSVFAWIRFTGDPTAAIQTIVGKRDANNDGWWFSSINGTLRMSIDAIDISSSTQITDNDWHFVGATITRAGNGQLYLDGLPDGSPVAISGEVMSTTTDMRFGINAYSFTFDFQGEMDQVLIYDRVLNPSEITSLSYDSFQIFEQERLPIVAAAAPAEEYSHVMIIMGSSSLIVVFIAFSFWISGKKAA